MTYLSALYFPEIILQKMAIRQLLLFCKTVTFYQIFDDNSKVNTDILFKNGLCINHLPISPGKDLHSFQQLLHNVTDHEREYYAGYISTLLIKFAQDSEEASSWTLSSRIRKADPVQDKEENKQKTTLWQAMLLLKLAEVLTREEQEIVSELLKIADRKAQVLDNIHGVNSETRQRKFSAFNVQVPPAQPLVNIAQLTKAWGQLFIRDHAAAAPLMLVTAQTDAADLLLNTYEKRYKQKPYLLCNLDLPDLQNITDENYLKKRQEFRKIAAISHLAEYGKSGQPTPDTLQKINQTIAFWPDYIAKFFGTKTTTHTLNVFLLAGTSSQNLFHTICQPDIHRSLPPSSSNTILVVVRES